MAPRRGSRLVKRRPSHCTEDSSSGGVRWKAVRNAETGELHKAHMVRHDLPILISIVDTPENIDRLIPVIGQTMNTGLMAQSDVQMIRVQRWRAAPGGEGR